MPQHSDVSSLAGPLCLITDTQRQLISILKSHMLVLFLFIVLSQDDTEKRYGIQLLIILIWIQSVFADVWSKRGEKHPQV